MDTLISNVTAVTMNPRMEVIFGAYIGIEDGKIVSIERKPPAEAPKAIVDGTGMVAIPGLINCHTHLATASLRCFTDDLGNTEALQALLQKEAKMDSRSAKAAASLAIAECLRFGVTSVSDLYYYPNATAEAVAESGIKANLALSSYRYIDENEDFDFETDEQCRELVKVTEKWNGFDGGRIKIDAGIYAEYISNYRLWEGLVGYAAEQNLGMQLHLAETQSEVDSCLERTGMNPGELLNCHNVFSRPTTAAGCTYLTEDERKLLGKKGVCAVATPRVRLQKRPILHPYSGIRQGGDERSPRHRRRHRVRQLGHVRGHALCRHVRPEGKRQSRRPPVSRRADDGDCLRRAGAETR